MSKWCSWFSLADSPSVDPKGREDWATEQVRDLEGKTFDGMDKNPRVILNATGSSLVVTLFHRSGRLEQYDCKILRYRGTCGEFPVKSNVPV